MKRYIAVWRKTGFGAGFNPSDNDFNGAMLFTLREERGWTQTELGERMGCRANQISEWERGRRRISNANLAALAEVFDVSIALLCEAPEDDEGGTS